MSFPLLFFLLLAPILLVACENDTDGDQFEAEVRKAWIVGESDTVQVNATQFSLYLPTGRYGEREHSVGFTISPGATANQPSPLAVTGDHFQVVVRSANRRVARTYSGSILYFNEVLRFDFEKWRIEKEGQGPGREYPIPDGGWSSGNDGISLLNTFNSQADPCEFPTRPVDRAVGGAYAVEMVTVDTRMKENPVAAGSLFLGRFDVSRALTNPKQSLVMGHKFMYQEFPLRFTGQYSYTRGTQIIDKHGVLGPEGDKATMYAVLFHGQPLTAEEIFTSKRVIAIARREVARDVPEYEPFSIDFVYRYLPEQLPEDVMFTICFSSSSRGQDFAGAVGSCLRVDDVEIVVGDRAQARLQD